MCVHARACISMRACECVLIVRVRAFFMHSCMRACARVFVCVCACLKLIKLVLKGVCVCVCVFCCVCVCCVCVCVCLKLILVLNGMRVCVCVCLKLTQRVLNGMHSMPDKTDKPTSPTKRCTSS